MAHGGAWDWDDTLDAGKHAGLEKALKTGFDILQQGGTAVEAVEHTVISLENNPVFDAGTGAAILIRMA